MSNSALDPDQARPFVGPDLGPSCLQRLSEDDTSRQNVLKDGLVRCLIVWIPGLCPLSYFVGGKLKTYQLHK